MMTLKHLQPRAFIGAPVIAVAALAVPAEAQRYGSVTVYNDINFQGESATFSGEMPNLTQNGWNDRISSITIPDGQVWEVCVDINYGGGCHRLTSSVPDLRNVGLNDKISSIRPLGGRYGNYNRDV